MPFLTPAEISSHLYNEVVNEINRTDSTLLQTAINAAIAEAKGYVTAYDVAAIFAATGDNRNPILLLYVKDFAVWHYIQLANPNVEMQLRLERYEKAIKWFDKVQRGQTNPDLPYPAAPVDAAGNPNPNAAENFIKFGSNAKRNNHY